VYFLAKGNQPKMLMKMITGRPCLGLTSETSSEVITPSNVKEVIRPDMIDPALLVSGV